MSDLDPGIAPEPHGAGGGEPGEGSMNRYAVSGAAWSVIQSWGGRVVSTFVFIVIGRLLTPEDFGLVSLGSILIDVGALLTVSGFHRALVQRKQLDPEHLDAAFWSSVFMGTALCLATVASAGWIADLLGEPRFAPVLRALSLTFLITGVGAVPSAILHRRMEFKAFAIRQLLAITLGGAAGVTLALLGAGPWALVAQSLTSAFVGVIVVLVNARWRPRFRFSKQHWRDIAGFGVLAMLIDGMDIAAARLDDLLIGVVLGATALGYYGVAYRTYAIALEVVGYSLSAVTFPIFSRIAEDRQRAGRAIITTTRFTAAGALPVFLGLAVVADNAVIGLFGDQWTESVPVLRILCLTAAAGAGALFVRDVVLAAGQPRMEIIKSVLVTVLLATGFAVGVHWGITGVAWSRLAASAILVPIEIYIMHKVVRFDFRAFARAYLQPIPACLAMIAVVWSVKATFHPDAGSILWLFALVAIGGVTYVGVLTITARETVRELEARVRTRHQ